LKAISLSRHQAIEKGKISFALPAWSRPLFAGTRGSPRYKAAKGGRASGKSHFFAEILLKRMIEDPNTKAICIREVQRSLEFSSKQLLADKIIAMGLGHYFEVQQTRIRSLMGEGIIIFQGMQDHTSDSVKSLEGFDIAWCEEAQSLSSRSIELLDPTIRKEGSEIWFSWNPYKKTDPVEEFFENNNQASLVHVNYLDNPFCSENIKEMAERAKAQNISKYNHVWLGDYMKDIDGALWKDPMIKSAQGSKEIPQMSRIVVAIDPAVTASQNSDETGIIVAGRADDKFYILDDLSLRASPDTWARAVVEAYHHWNADRIVAEVNNGGDLVEKVIRTIDRSVPYTPVRASRGKILRAEPIAALYEQGKVSHCGEFRELEDQMTSYTPLSKKSPDRLDALVWALTELSRSTGQAVWRIS
jgi:PBSX family phage terminase large subunit